MRHRKLLLRALNNPNDLRFDEAVALAMAFGFELRRTEGSHHILRRTGVAELVCLQNVHGRAKAYQVRQLLKLVERYNLHLEDEA